MMTCANNRDRNRPESLTIEEKYRVTEVLGHSLEWIYSVSRVLFVLVTVITRGMNLVWVTKSAGEICFEKDV